MGQYYSQKEKALAIQKLIENLGDTKQTAADTGISERTIQRWKSSASPSTVLIADDLASSLNGIVRQKYIFIRNQLIDHIQRISAEMTEYPERTVDLTMALTRLIDRLSKLEQLSQQESFTLIVLWENQEGFVLEDPFMEF